MTTDILIKKINDTGKDIFTREDIINIISHIVRPTISSGCVTINPDKYAIIVNGKEHIVAKKIFELSYYLMSNKNRIMNKNKILDDVWGTDIIVDDRTIDVHVRKIRILTGDFIKTIKTQGYSWVEN